MNPEEVKKWDIKAVREFVENDLGFSEEISEKFEGINILLYTNSYTSTYLKWYL